jgi:threonine synthase
MIVCSSCVRTLAAQALSCPCGGVPQVGFEPPALGGAALRDAFRLRRISDAPLDRSGVWRFRELLPPIARPSIVTLTENVLPLHDANTGAAYSSIAGLRYLHQGANPTGSFKDGGMTVAVSQAKARGARVAVCASTGNTASSMAAYAARAGLRAIVVVPASGISEAKLAQVLDYGATAVAVEADFDAALEAVRALDPDRVAIVNSVNPYRIEGQKCAAFVLLEQLGWSAPDWIVLPGGNLGNTSAFGKGLREAQALGLIDRLPRIAVVQASGAAPFARVFRDGGDLQPVAAQTSATAIRIGAPASWRRALAIVRETGGAVVDVDDEAIADARAVVGRDGIGCEPASAAALAGARLLRERGTIEAGQRVVAVLTGHVLKDGAYAAAYHAGPGRYANAIVRAPASGLQRLIDDALAF